MVIVLRQKSAEDILSLIKLMPSFAINEQNGEPLLGNVFFLLLQCNYHAY